VHSEVTSSVSNPSIFPQNIVRDCFIFVSCFQTSRRSATYQVTCRAAGALSWPPQFNAQTKERVGLTFIRTFLLEPCIMFCCVSAFLDWMAPTVWKLRVSHHGTIATIPLAWRFCIIDLFIICNLFNYAFSATKIIQRRMKGRWMNDEFKRIWKEAVVA
jgi:hypothetical protein